MTLSSLFGEKRDLFVIHNMGRGCNSCTMWADGFNGLYPHIADRASFVVSNAETPAQQAEFAASRGWKFPMVSTQGTSVRRRHGFRQCRRKADARRVGVPEAGRKDRPRVRLRLQRPDEFCPVWRLFDLLPEGADDWRPKQTYG